MVVNKTLAGMVLALSAMTGVTVAQQTDTTTNYVTEDSISGTPSAKRTIDEIYKNTVIHLGTFTLEDISIEAIRRLRQNSSLCYGLEYTYIRYKDEKYKPIRIRNHHGIMGSIGAFNDDAGIFFKSGIVLKDGKAIFNYGGEIMFTFDEGKKPAPSVGMSVTKEYIQLKFGIAF